MRKAADSSSMSYTLRIATLNLRHNADRWPERLPLVVDGFVRELPHLVALQEVHIPSDQAGLLATEVNHALEAAGQPARYEYRLQPKIGPEGEQEGIAVFSHLPIVDYAWLDLGGGARVAQRVRVQLPGGALVDLYNAHLHHTHDADELRRAQARRIVAWATEQSQGAAAIIAGDMNALPDSAAIAAFKEAFASAYALAHGGEPPYTFPTPLVRRQDWRGTLDYIFLPRHLEVQSARLVFDQPAAGDATLYPSDHYGLVADVALQTSQHLQRKYSGEA